MAGRTRSSKRTREEFSSTLMNSSGVASGGGSPRRERRMAYGLGLPPSSKRINLRPRTRVSYQEDDYSDSDSCQDVVDLADSEIESDSESDSNSEFGYSSNDEDEEYKEDEEDDEDDEDDEDEEDDEDDEDEEDEEDEEDDEDEEDEEDDEDEEDEEDSLYLNNYIKGCYISKIRDTKGLRMVCMDKAKVIRACENQLGDMLVKNPNSNGPIERITEIVDVYRTRATIDHWKDLLEISDIVRGKSRGVVLRDIRTFLFNVKRELEE